MNNLEINRWLSVTKPYRSKLDLATIISYKMELEEIKRDDWEGVLDEIKKVANDLIDEKYLNFDISIFNQVQRRPSKPSDFKKSLIKTAFIYTPLDPQRLSDNERWLYEYRQQISKVTKYSDDMYFSEEAFYADFDSLDENCIPPEYFDPVLRNSNLTMRFIDLDLLLDRFDEEGMKYHDYLRISIPDTFRFPKRNVDEKIKKNNYKNITFKSDFKKNDEFFYLKVSKLSQEFFFYDRRGLRLLKANIPKKMKAGLLTEIKSEHGEQNAILIDHIWRLIMPINGRVARTKGLKVIRENLQEFIDIFWGDDYVDIWKRGGKNGRIELAKKKGFNEVEARTILAMLTPRSITPSGKPSLARLKHFKELIKDVNLDWLGEKFPNLDV